jgi:hypothetical protein
MADAMKLGDRHTAIMDAIHGDLLRQNPGAFVEEDGNATLVIATPKPFLTIDVSSLAEAVLPLAASPPAREEAPAEGAGDLIAAFEAAVLQKSRLTGRVLDEVRDRVEREYQQALAALRNLIPAKGSREQEIIARVVDPKAWADLDDALANPWTDGGKAVREAHRPYLAPSLKTASAIMALNRCEERAVWRVRDGDSWRYYDGPDAEAEARRGDAGADGGQVESAVFS